MMNEEELRAELARLLREQESLSAGSVGGGRKMQVLQILSDGKEHTVKNIAKALGIESTNVSSQLTYLKKDGWAITSGLTKSHKKVLLDGDGKPRNLTEEKRALQARLASMSK
jgi:DNA-binding MarR family transcriptional regulator